jgi:integrase
MALTEIELVEKLKAGTATVEEAIDFANSSATISDNAKKRIGALVSGFKKMGLDITMPYKDLKNDDVAPLFTKAGSPTKENRAPNLQALENHLEKLFNKYGISGIKEKVPGSDIEQAMYPRLTGAGTAIGTQRTGMAGERPMRGLLSMEDFTRIYVEAVPLIENEYDQATADLIRYHATTSNRPSQLQKLKKSDVTISGNTITVAGKKVTKNDKKGRPSLSFDLDSPTGQLLKRNLDSSKSEFLFDTTDAKFNDAFAKHITPRLEPFSDILPLAEVKVEGPDGIQLSQKPVTSPSAIRSIVPKIMLDQYNVPEGLVQGMMGHVNDSILRKNYAGLAPSTDIPKLLENPSSFAVGDFGTTEKNINLDLLSDEDRAVLIQEQKATLQAEEKARQATATAIIAEKEAAAIKAKAAVTPEEIEAASRVDEAAIRQQVRDREAKKRIEADELAKIKGELDLTGDISDEGKSLFKRLGMLDDETKLGIGIGATGAGLTAIGVIAAPDKAQAASEVARDVAIDVAGEAGLKSIVGRTIAGRVPVADLLIPSASMADQELQAGDRPATQEELMSQVRQREAERAAMREREATAEAAMQQGDSFMTMQP